MAQIRQTGLDAKEEMLATDARIGHASVVKHVGCHTFRYSFTTNLLEASHGIPNYQEFLVYKDVSTILIYSRVLNRGGHGYTAQWMGCSPVHIDYVNRKLRLAYNIKDVDMTEFKCDTISHGNFFYGKKRFVFTFLYRLDNYC